MESTHQTSWKRLKRFICTAWNRNKVKSPDLISVLPQPVPEKRPSALKIPLRMVNARVSDLVYAGRSEQQNLAPQPQEITFRQKYRFYRYMFLHSFFLFCVKWYLRKGIKFTICLLLTILVAEGIFWFWVWHLPPDKLQNFTSCLDAGVVPSWKERFIYHVSCFWGSL